ncbi:AMIN domain-containing protein [Solidesulfovibrio sp. C21]|uniref:AMIN domain-containing protein n=1 Tax=Solidesulfovibrio sp. C21 TaxID=3398613 RepID=UPI0039FC7B23
MALTRGDKMIILGAVALAATVVLGLAILKRPGLFSGGKEPVANIAPAPTAATPAPPAPAAVSAPVAAPAAAPVQPVQPAPPPPPVPQVAAPQATPAAAEKTPVPAGQTPQGLASGPQDAAKPAAPGDENLEKMFAEISGDAAPAEKPGEANPVSPKAASSPEPKAAPAPGENPPPPAAVSEGEPAPAPAKADAKASSAAAKSAKDKNGVGGKADAKAKHEPAASKPAAAPAKAAPKPKPTVAAAKSAAKPAVAPHKATDKSAAAMGRVIRVIGEEKPGVYELVIQTTKPPASFTKMFLTNPPRMVLDIAGSWDYHGAAASDTGGAFIRRIRIGRHTDLFRVVLDMAPDAPARLRGAPTVSRVPEGVALRIPK